MPAGATQQIDRMVSSAMNAGSGDATPGQSVSSGTGQSSYGGQVGARVALGPTDLRSASAVGTLLGGIYQYVFMTYTTAQPARGKLVFWDLSVAEANYQVNGDAKPTAAIPTLIAGVVLNTLVTQNTYAWMQIGGRASVLFNSTITAGGVAGSPVSAYISPAVASTSDVNAADTALSTVTVYGIAETIPVLSVISVVQLNNTLAMRRI